ncbi:type II secretion system protein GspD [Silanimonas algicola]
MPSPLMPARLTVAVLLSLVLAGCATSPPSLPEPLRAPLPAPEASTEAPAEDAAGSRISEGPRAEAPPARVLDARRSPVAPGGAPVALAIDGANLTAFIDEVFANQLGFSIEVEQAVRDKPDLVSLRLVDPEPPNRLYAIAEEVLKRYGVAVVPEQGRLRFTAEAGAVVDTPQLLTGRALPEVPAGQRPIFVFMPLDVANPARISAQVRTLFGRVEGLQVTELDDNNALLLSGPPALVNSAMEAVQLLDRTGLREKRSLRITPLYLSVDVLAKELRELLVGQGFTFRGTDGTGGVLTLVPVASANALVVFSESDAALEAVAQWAETLDQPADDGGTQAGAYIYQVRHTTAESLRTTMEALIGGTPSAGAAGGTGSAEASGSRGLQGGGGIDGGSSATAGNRSAPQATVSVAPDGSRIVVDPQRNAIIFQGEASRWRTLQSVLARLDQPARQVLVEVTVAEVTLTDEFSHGVEWALREAGISDFGGSLSAYGGSVANRGVVWRPISSSGQVRAVMNLFQNSTRVNILSTPRLMVRSGESASIDVGTEVPILTSQATAPDLGGVTPSILQQVQYRKTGVLLEIQPVVHSSQRVDLTVSQEVSEAQQTESSSISSPSIFSRRLQTAMSVSDGEATLMGGLISNTTTTGGSEIPGLGRIPVVGELFRSRSRTGNRTELMVLITPYVIEDAAQARQITEALRSRLGEIPR